MPRSKELVTAEALIEIASDPNRYRELMDQYQVRQREAVVAEGKAHEAGKVAGAAEARAKASQSDLAETSTDLSKREAALVDRNQDYEDRAAKVKVAENAVSERERDVHRREDALAGLHATALDAVAGLIRGVK